MPLTCGTLTVGTTATRILAPSTQPTDLILQNYDNTDTIFLGCSNVTTASGYNLAKQETFRIRIEPGNTIWAISSKAGHSLGFIRQF